MIPRLYYRDQNKFEEGSHRRGWHTDRRVTYGMNFYRTD